MAINLQQWSVEEIREELQHASEGESGTELAAILARFGLVERTGWIDFAVTSLDRTQLVSLVAAIRRLRNLVVAPRSIEQEGAAVFPHRPRLDRSASFIYLRHHYPNLVPEARARVLRYTDFSVTWSIDALIVSLEKFQFDAPIHVLVERVEDEVARTAV